jgi:hypothetical protein
MKPAPPDWQNEDKLWNLLGESKSKSPSNNFSALVQQKTSYFKTINPRPTIWAAISQYFTGWQGAVTLATACLMIGLVVFTQRSGSKMAPVTGHGEPSMLMGSDGPGVKEVETIEIAQLAVNFDLIQDLDVIEHLHELEMVQQ